jgi:hypothetical protein
MNKKRMYKNKTRVGDVVGERGDSSIASPPELQMTNLMSE